MAKEQVRHATAVMGPPEYAAGDPPRVPPKGGSSTAPPFETDPEKEALKAQLADLRRKVDELLKVGVSQVIDDQWEQQKIWLGLSAQEKSQANADRLFAGVRGPGIRRFACSIKDWPEVVLPAHSPEEAKARYYGLCGIRMNDETINPFACAPAGGPETADAA